MLNNKTRDLNPSFRIIVGPTFGYEENFKGGPIQFNEIYKCDVLNTSLHISSNGDILPCSFINYPLGNLKQTLPSEVFRSDRSILFRKVFLDKGNHNCQGCSYYENCKGGCIAEKFHLLFGEKRVSVKDIYCFRK